MDLAMSTSAKGCKENYFHICVKPSSYEVQIEFIKLFPPWPQCSCPHKNGHVV